MSTPNFNAVLVKRTEEAISSWAHILLEIIFLYTIIYYTLAERVGTMAVIVVKSTVQMMREGVMVQGPGPLARACRILLAEFQQIYR